MVGIDKSNFVQLSSAIAKHFSLAMSAEQVLISLPDGKLNSMHIEQGLGNIGVSASLQKAHVKNKVSHALLPALVACEDGHLLLITDKQTVDNQSTAKNDQVFTVIGITQDNKAHQLSRTELQQKQVSACWLVSNKKLVQGRSDYVMAKNQHWLTPVINAVKPYYGALLLGSFTINLLALVIPLFTMNVYDRVVPNAAIDTLWALAIGAILAVVFDWFLKQARTQLADVAGREIDVLVSSTLFAKVIGMKLENRPQSSGAYAKQVQEFDSVREFLTSATLVSAIDLPFTLLFLALITWLGGVMVLIPIIAMAVIILTGIVLKNKLNTSVEEASKLATQKQAYLIEYLNQIVEVKQCNGEGKSQRIWEQTVGQLADWQNQSRLIVGSLTHTVMSMQQFTTIGLIAAGVYQIQAGNISMGALIAMVMISGRASSAISQIASLILKYKQTTTAMESVKAILALEQEINDQAIGSELEISGHIRLNNVNFNYPEQTLKVIKDFSIDIKPAEKIGLYGVAGSGKSTLLALLAGQYGTTQGQIFYDDIELKQWPISHIRNNSAWVAQNPSLFYGTVLDNITSGCEPIDTKRLTQAIKLSGIGKIVERLESGLESQVGEFGRCLSGGQRQAVVIARALLKQSKVMFLDEPSSAMDEMSERHLIATLKNIKNTTMIIASHKASVLNVCDRILVIDKGELTAIKTPQQLFGLPQRKVSSVAVKASAKTVSAKASTPQTSTVEHSAKDND
jgi:type I secretion system LssB family ATPase